MEFLSVRSRSPLAPLKYSIVLLLLPCRSFSVMAVQRIGSARGYELHEVPEPAWPLLEPSATPESTRAGGSGLVSSPRSAFAEKYGDSTSDTHEALEARSPAGRDQRAFVAWTLAFVEPPVRWLGLGAATGARARLLVFRCVIGSAWARSRRPTLGRGAAWLRCARLRCGPRRRVYGAPRSPLRRLR